MHETRLIPRIDPTSTFGVTEDELRCYPLRRDSLAAYSRVVQGVLAKMHVHTNVQMTPDEAAAARARQLLRRDGVRGG